MPMLLGGPTFWFLAAAVLLVVEGLTVNLITIWFAAGSVAALLVSLFTPNLVVQAVVFTAVSLLCLLLLKPLAENLRRPGAATNADRNLGRTAVVLTRVTAAEPGRVRLDGVDWNARTSSSAVLEPGQSCTVVNIQSTLLIVEPQPVPAGCEK